MTIPKIELRQHEVGANDLFVLRTDAPISEEEIEAFHSAIEKIQPEWRGALFVLGFDTQLEKLDEAAQRALFDLLAERFAE